MERFVLYGIGSSTPEGRIYKLSSDSSGIHWVNVSNPALLRRAREASTLNGL